MNLKEWRLLSIAELRKELVSLSRQISKLRIQKRSGIKVNTHLFGKNKKNCARILTLISEKQQQLGENNDN